MHYKMTHLEAPDDLSDSSGPGGPGQARARPARFLGVTMVSAVRVAPSPFGQSCVDAFTTAYIGFDHAACPLLAGGGG